MVGIHCVGVGVDERQSDDYFVCFGAKPTQRACARNFLRDRKKTRKRQGTRTEQRGVSDSQGKVTVRERWLLREELGPVDREARSASVRGWVSVPGSSVGISFESCRSHRTPENCQNLSMLRDNPSPCFLVLFSTFCYICYVCCKICEIPLAGDEKNHKTIEWSWADLRSWDTGGRPAGILSHTQITVICILIIRLGSNFIVCHLKVSTS